MKKCFLAFGDGADNFVAARDRIVAEAKALGVFDCVWAVNWDDASVEMKKWPGRSGKIGCGFYAWKPDAIWLALQKMDYGDVLVYCDSGCVLNRSRCQWKRLLKVLENHDILVRRIHACAFNWVRRELLDLFRNEGITHGSLLCSGFEATAIVIKKTPFTEMLVAKWRVIVLEHPKAIMSVESKEERESQLPTFERNVYDQSLLTLLILKYLSDAELREKIAIMTEFHFGWWLLGDPAIIFARNRSGVKMRVGFKSRLRRAFVRLAWSGLVLLEKWTGIHPCWGVCKTYDFPRW